MDREFMKKYYEHTYPDPILAVAPSIPDYPKTTKLYAEYRTARAEMQEYQIAKRNVEMFYELQDQEEKQQTNRENTR